MTETLVDALERAPASRPFVTMWHDEDAHETLTFGAFHAAADDAATTLARRGVTSGQTVVLLLPQSIDLMVWFVGALRLGAVPTILAYPHRKMEPAKYRAGLLGVLKNLGARVVVRDAEFPAELHRTLEGVEVVVTGAGTTREERESPLSRVPLAPEQVAFIQHSAGTTGLQKGVALSHAAVLRHIEHLAGALKITGDDRVYSWLPLYHDMGLIACFMLPLARHCHVVMQDPLAWVMQPGTMLELVTRFRCTLAWLPNFAFQFLARRVPRETRDAVDLASLRAVINCSEPVRAASIDEFAEAFAPHGLHRAAIHTSYAMAETVFAVSQSALGAAGGPARLHVDADALRTRHVIREVPAHTAGVRTLVSSGRLLPGSEVRIASPDGASQPEGHVGDILIRSDSLFDGYYHRPDLTAASLRDGWYDSGDLGFVHGAELYVIGRRKDLIIVAGRNIYPEDVEAIAAGAPQIHDGRAVALGVDNPALGTEDIVIVAEVARLDDLEQASVIERDIRQAVSTELGVVARSIYLKPPGWIVKSTAGKPARTDTRAKLLAEHPELQG